MGLSAQTFRTLPDDEIEACETPQAVAWNFVESILRQDYARMESLTDSLALHLMKKGERYAQKRNLGAVVRVTVIQKDRKWKVLNIK